MLMSIACSFFILLKCLRLSLPLCEGELSQERRFELAACPRAGEGKSSWVERQPGPCWALLGLLALQPAFIGFFFILWMSWSLKNWYLSPLTAQRKYFLKKMWILSWSKYVFYWHCVLLSTVLWPWVALNLLGNKWIKGDCHWQSERCLSQTSLGSVLNVCQYFSVCSFILAFSRSFKRGLNVVPDDPYWEGKTGPSRERAWQRNAGTKRDFQVLTN